MFGAFLESKLEQCWHEGHDTCARTPNSVSMQKNVSQSLICNPWNYLWLLGVTFGDRQSWNMGFCNLCGYLGLLGATWGYLWRRTILEHIVMQCLGHSGLLRATSDDGQSWHTRVINSVYLWRRAILEHGVRQSLGLRGATWGYGYPDTPG